MPKLKNLLLSLAVLLTLTGKMGYANAETLGRINFDFDSAVLTTEARAQVAQIAERIAQSGSIQQVVVTGHTDAVGSDGYNQELGLRRARAVATALTGFGISVSQIGTVQSRGEQQLLVQVSTPERQNRRVTVSYADLLAACRSYRNVMLPQEVGDGFMAELRDRLAAATQVRTQLSTTGTSSAVYQVAGAAVEDCSTAANFRPRDGRFEEYAKRCVCNYARISMLR